MAIGGYMILTDNDELYDGSFYPNRTVAKGEMDKYLGGYPLLRVVEVEIRPKKEMIRFYEG